MIIIKRILYGLLIVSLALNCFVAYRMHSGIEQFVLARFGHPMKQPPDDIWQIRDDEFKFLSHQDPDATVFIGDSITDYFNLDEYFRGMDVINRGIVGDTMAGVLKRLNESVIDLKPKNVVILMGINDLVLKRSDTSSNYESIIAAIKKRTPKTKIIIVSVLPTTESFAYLNPGINTLDDDLMDICAKDSVIFIDMRPELTVDGQLNSKYTIDGLHLSGEGYRVLTDRVKAFLD